MLAPTSHRITDAVTTLRTELTTLTDAPVYAMSDDDLEVARTEVHRLRAQVDELELRLAHQATTRDIDVKTSWVRDTHQAPRTAATRLKLATTLDHHQQVRTAMAAGAVTEAQAKVVVAAVEALPHDLPGGLVDRAEAHLLELCADHHPDELRELGKHLVAVVAPDLAEAHEAKVVDAEYRHALETCRLSLFDRHDGTWEGRFILPATHAHLLKKLLFAFAAPKHQTATGETWDADKPTPQRLAGALCELIERYPVDRTPHAGGLSARAMVTLTLDDLATRLHENGTALVDDLIPLPAWEARRMACEAGLLPAVLGGKSEILDLGRTRRLHSEPQRVAIHHRDHTCRADGCDWPAALSHTHHVQPWAHGGPTDITNALTLCPRHHRRAHDPTYEMTTGKNGRVLFRRM